jgi:predicted permease
MFWRRRSERDFSEELQAHLELETDRLVRDEGLSHEDARAAAHRAFGNVTLTRERFHDANRWAWLEQLLQDLRYATRVLRQSPAFLVTAVLTLAVGIAVVTLVFTVFNAYFLRPYAIRHPETLHRIAWRSQAGGGETFRWRDYQAIRDRRDLFDGVIAQDFQLVTFEGRPMAAALVSENYFEALAPRLALGRGLAPVDTQGAGRAAVISHTAWSRFFTSDPAVLGREIEMSGQRFTIVGVVAPEFVGLGDTPHDLWVPLTTYAAVLKPELTGPQQPRSVELLAHLRDGVSIEQARGSLTPMIAATLEREQNVRADVRQESTPVPIEAELWLVIGPIFVAFGLVLATACANVSNVMLARAIARHREIAVRLSLGASRGRIVRQLLTEGLLIALVAGLAGLVLAALGLRAGTALFFSALPPSAADIFRLAPMGTDVRVFTFALLVAAAATLLFALLPALQASRLSLVAALRGHGAGALRSSRWRSALVIAQVTVSIVLVVVALTFVRQGATLGAADIGYQTSGVVSVTPRGDARRLLTKLATVLAADDRVTALAVTSINPLKRDFARQRVAAAPLDAASTTGTRYTFVSPEYFTLLRIPIERGRPFRPEEASGAARVAIVSAATARAFWPGQDPIGQTIRIEPANGRPVDEIPEYAIVTVVGTTRDVVSGFIVDGPDPGHIYLPITATNPNAAAFLLRGRSDRDLTPAVLQELLGRVGADAQSFESMPLEEMRGIQMFPLRAASFVGTMLAALALALSVTGLYGVLTYNVNQRTREIGIRMALGASGGAVVGLVMRQSVRLAGVGAAVGLAIAFAAMQALNSAIQLEHLSMVDASAFVSGVALVLGATAVAAFHPARRATRVDPANTLRADA